MLVKNAENRGQMDFVSLEDMVPLDHLLRKIDAAIDFRRIYEFVEDLYCEDNGRPSVDPVVLFKIVLIQHIYGIPSLRRTLEEVNMNLAYRWFIGYPLNEAVPHFSTVSYNFKHRFNHATVEYEKALKRYSVGNRYVGTVSMVDTTGVFVALDGGVDCLCSYPKRGRPPRGSRVTVRILGMCRSTPRTATTYSATSATPSSSHTPVRTRRL